MDVTRVKRTRCGHEVRIYATDGGQNGSKIHGAILACLESGWQPFIWQHDGQAYMCSPNHPYDLIEEPRKVEVDVWMNVYSFGASGGWPTKESADENALRNRIACIHIQRTVTEGEGLQ